MIAHIYPSVLQAVSGRGYAGCLEECFQGYRGEDMQDPGYGLPRIYILRTPVNKGKKKGREPTWAPGSLRSNFRLRAVLLVPGAYARALVRPA
jgi:hypothetical protein